MPLFQRVVQRGALRAAPSPIRMRWSWRPSASNGNPSARVVLCKRVDVAAGYVVFFTNYRIAQGTRARRTAARCSGVSLGRIASAGADRRPGRAFARRRERPVFREPRARQPDRRMGQRAKRAARFTRSARSNACASSPHASASRRARRTAQCHGRRIGAVIGCGSTRSSCGSEGADRMHDRAVWTRDAATRTTSIRSPAGLAQHAPESLTRSPSPTSRLSASAWRASLRRSSSAAGSLGGAGGCGGASASEKIIPCPVSRA